MERKTLRSQDGGSRGETRLRRSASHKYSRDSLPPSSNTNNSNNSNNNISARNKHRSSSVVGRRRTSGSYDDNLNVNKFNNGGNNVRDGTSNNQTVENNDAAYSYHHQRQQQQQQGSHTYLRYNSRLSQPRGSVDEGGEGPSETDQRRSSFLNRRSSSAMRVRELRDVLTSMTSSQGDEEEQEMKGSQKARLLVASQQRLMSRLQDLSHQLDSIDNEVTRVKGDIISSRRYFSAMTGIPYGPEWHTTRQMDSAYTSPTSCLSPRSSDGSPSPSEIEWSHGPTPGTASPPTVPTVDHAEEVTCTPRMRNPAHPAAMTGHVSSAERQVHSSSLSVLPALESPFRSLADFDEVGPGEGLMSGGSLLTRSDSCSSFMSWRSDQEMASLFPDEVDTAAPDIHARYGGK
ncbi:hypothetical protein EGW08_007988 [Elysia chlorotica]|uniref:Uncharacterized protein n=1 Tax=Elysia chlorotica TaxID=188477 RepID=A0A3S1BI65_ELYCH|nr:hypothetical protein EGW08_007988 [Elysia chlorotica]